MTRGGRATRHFLMQLPSWRLLPESNKVLADFTGWLARTMMTATRPVFGFYGEKMPSTRMWESGVRLYMAGLKSDWSQRWKMHYYSRFAGKVLCCEHDLASTHPPHLYGDLSATPAFCATLMTHQEHLANEPHQSPWWVALRDAGMVKDRHFPDGMHTLFKAGIASDLVASYLVMLVEPPDDELRPHGAVVVGKAAKAYRIAQADASLKLLFAEFLKWLRTHGIRHHRMSTWTMVRLMRSNACSYPSVVDRYKCGDMKSMLLWAASHSVSNINDAIRDGRAAEVTDEQKYCALALSALGSYVRGTCLAGPLLSDLERTELVRHGRQYMACYQWLAQEFLRRRVCLFKLRPKIHSFWHIVFRLSEGDAENPRIHEVWGEESLGGLVATVTRSCYSGSAMVRTCNRWAGAMLSDVGSPFFQ